jgi:hypothetical protein
MGVILAHGAPVCAQSAESGKLISLNFQNAPVTMVLKTLFATAQADYRIDPDVQGSVNIALNDVPFVSALHSLLRSANPPLTFDYADGVYEVKVKHSVPAATVAAVDSTSGGMTADSNSEDTTTDDRRWYKLPIDHADVTLILQYVGVTKGVFVIPSEPGERSGTNRGGLGSASSGLGSAGMNGPNSLAGLTGFGGGVRG